MKLLTSLTLGFALTVVIGASITEYTRVLVAKQIGYKNGYFKSIAQNDFYSESMGKKYDYLKDKFETFEKASKSEEWKILKTQTIRDFAIIEGGVKLLCAVLSHVGFAFVFYLSLKSVIDWKFWISSFFALFFMRDVILAIINLKFAYPCMLSRFWNYFAINSFTAQRITLAVGFVLLLLLIYKVPRRYRLKYLTAGALGSLMGLYLWVFHLGKFLF